LEEAVNTASTTAESAFARSAAPDAREYAASAFIDAASLWGMYLKLSACSCAAQAFACDTGEKAGETRYDEVYEQTFSAELFSGSSGVTQFGLEDQHPRSGG
jgi:hypothetical protein